jgi:hypothetical protein
MNVGRGPRPTACCWGQAALRYPPQGRWEAGTGEDSARNPVDPRSWRGGERSGMQPAEAHGVTVNTSCAVMRWQGRGWSRAGARGVESMGYLQGW